MGYKEKILDLSNGEMSKILDDLGYSVSVNFMTRGTIDRKIEALSENEILELAKERDINLNKLF